MWPFTKRNLQAQLMQILREYRDPLTLEQIVARLYCFGRPPTDLLVLSASEMRRKKILKCHAEKHLQSELFAQKKDEGSVSYFLSGPGADAVPAEPLISS